MRRRVLRAIIERELASRADQRVSDCLVKEPIGDKLVN